MPLLTIEELRSHVRVIGSQDDADLMAMLASATDAAAARLNRTIYEDQAAMDAAMDALPDEAADAQADYDAAVAAAKEETDCAKRDAMLMVAGARIATARRVSVWTVNGIVANDSILAAIKLTVGHLYENREAVVVGVGAAEVPAGVAELLRPYRRVMMP